MLRGPASTKSGFASCAMALRTAGEKCTVPRRCCAQYVALVASAASSRRPVMVEKIGVCGAFSATPFTSASKGAMAASIMAE
jgi:hypothetical protein